MALLQLFNNFMRNLTAINTLVKKVKHFIYALENLIHIAMAHSRQGTQNFHAVKLGRQ